MDLIVFDVVVVLDWKLGLLCEVCCCEEYGCVYGGGFIGKGISIFYDMIKFDGLL